MRVQFYYLGEGPFARAELREVQGGHLEIPMGTPPLERRTVLERCFLNLVSAHPELPPLIAVSETEGVACPPGAVVAAEILPMLAPEARRIAWVYRPEDELFAQRIEDRE